MSRLSNLRDALAQLETLRKLAAAAAEDATRASAIWQAAGNHEQNAASRVKDQEAWVLRLAESYYRVADIKPPRGHEGGMLPPSPRFVNGGLWESYQESPDVVPVPDNWFVRFTHFCNAWVEEFGLGGVQAGGVVGRLLPGRSFTHRFQAILTADPAHAMDRDLSVATVEEVAAELDKLAHSRDIRGRSIARVSDRPDHKPAAWYLSERPTSPGGGA